jgi:hypothetical protein
MPPHPRGGATPCWAIGKEGMREFGAVATQGTARSVTTKATADEVQDSEYKGQDEGDDPEYLHPARRAGR